MRAILLIMIGVSCLLASETVVDNKSGLMWQDDSASKSTKKDWQGAQSYCSELSLSGYDDWRLPNIKELQSIVDISRYKPAIKKGFKHTASDGYWSSSVYVSHGKSAWIVLFRGGSADYYSKTYEGYVRCVRGRQ